MNTTTPIKWADRKCRLHVLKHFTAFAETIHRNRKSDGDIGVSLFHVPPIEGLEKCEEYWVARWRDTEPGRHLVSITSNDKENTTIYHEEHIEGPDGDGDPID